MVNQPLARFVQFVELRCLKLVQLSILSKNPTKGSPQLGFFVITLDLF